MRKALVKVHDIPAAIFEELGEGKFRVAYYDDYSGTPISLTMPLTKKIYEFNQFPPFFDGLLPEGVLLEAVLRKYKLDKYDYFGQLLQVGKDVVGAVSVEALI